MTRIIRSTTLIALLLVLVLTVNGRSPAQVLAGTDPCATIPATDVPATDVPATDTPVATDTATATDTEVPTSTATDTPIPPTDTATATATEILVSQGGSTLAQSRPLQVNYQIDPCATATATLPAVVDPTATTAPTQAPVSELPNTGAGRE